MTYAYTAASLKIVYGRIYAASLAKEQVHFRPPKDDDTFLMTAKYCGNIVDNRIGLF